MNLEAPFLAFGILHFAIENLEPQKEGGVLWNEEKENSAPLAIGFWGLSRSCSESSVTIASPRFFGATLS